MSQNEILCLLSNFTFYQAVIAVRSFCSIGNKQLPYIQKDPTAWLILAPSKKDWSKMSCNSESSCVEAYEASDISPSKSPFRHFIVKSKTKMDELHFYGCIRMIHVQLFWHTCILLFWHDQIRKKDAVVRKFSVKTLAQIPPLIYAIFTRMKQLICSKSIVMPSLPTRS